MMSISPSLGQGPSGNSQIAGHMPARAGQLRTNFPAAESLGPLAEHLAGAIGQFAGRLVLRADHELAVADADLLGKIRVLRIIGRFVPFESPPLGFVKRVEIVAPREFPIRRHPGLPGRASISQARRRRPRAEA